MEHSNILINTKDRKEKELKITIEGFDDKELAHFGGLDLHVKATKHMIGDTNGMSFPEKEGDYLIAQKVAALYLNEIGEMLRSTSLDSDYLDDISNLELVKTFLDTIGSEKSVMRIIEQDNAEIQEEKEKDDEIWKSVIADIEKDINS